jgi:DNA-binding GntR family transcriptional regulator
VRKARHADTTSSGARRRTRVPVSDEVAAHVRAQIMGGSLQPAEFVEEVADDLSVSATPVREGLHALRGEGFLDLEPRRGFVVALLSLEDVEDLFAGRRRR